LRHLVLRSEIAIELLFRRFRRPARSFVACSVSPRDFYPFPVSTPSSRGCFLAGCFIDDDTAWALRRFIGASLLHRYSSASPPRSVTPAERPHVGGDGLSIGMVFRAGIRFLLSPVGKARAFLSNRSFGRPSLSVLPVWLASRRSGARHGNCQSGRRPDVRAFHRQQELFLVVAPAMGPDEGAEDSVSGAPHSLRVAGGEPAGIFEILAEREGAVPEGRRDGGVGFACDRGIPC